MQLFLLLLLLSPVAMVSSVDGCHSGRDKDHRPKENCTGAGFRDIPVGLDQGTKVLLFPNNLFSALFWTSFQVFTEIHELDLTANKIPEVTPSPAPVLPSLSVLRLGSNHLTLLSDGSFTACPALSELYLENNSISALSDDSFSGLNKLEILDLTANQISVLPVHLLHPLTAIETLYLESNQVSGSTWICWGQQSRALNLKLLNFSSKIKVMPNDWFIKKEEVPYLYLSANPWACSCSLSYLHKYLNEYEFNVYVRDGPIIQVDVESVVCDSPEEYKGKPVFTLEESDLCSVSTETGPPEQLQMTTEALYRTTSAAETTPATAAPTQVFLQLHTQHSVVTWSWYQTFTRYYELLHTSGSEMKTKRSLVGSFVLMERSTAGGPIEAVETTTGVPSTVTPTTPATTMRTTTTTTTTPATTTTMTTTTTTPATTTTTTTPATTTTMTTTTTTTPAMALTTQTLTTPSTSETISSVGFLGSAGSPGSVGVFCVWLFAGCLLLCLAAAACVLVTLVRLVTWYRTVYSPVSAAWVRRIKGSEEVELLMKRRTEEKEAGGGGVTALYRSVLFISREEEEAAGEEEEERGVYKKTLYRVVRREEEVEGWRDVVEECRVPGRRRVRGDQDLIGGEGGGAKKRYSLILREEREEQGGGREELDWVVGGWEVKRGLGGGEEVPRSSWGEWLAHYLPSMPWGVTTPPEEEAAQ